MEPVGFKAFSVPIKSQSNDHSSCGKDHWYKKTTKVLSLGYDNLYNDRGQEGSIQTMISLMWVSLVLGCLLAIWFRDSKKKLQAQLAKLESIQTQLWAVEEWEEENSLERNEAFHFCKEVEKSIIATYNNLVRQPRHFIPAKFYGYPTGLIGRFS